MEQSLTHICGTLIIRAEGAFLNGKGSETVGKSDITWPKYIESGESRIPYISAQAVRYWLRCTLDREINLIRNQAPEYFIYEDYPFLNIKDDLLGYFEGKLITLPDSGEITENAGIIRESPIRISPFISISNSSLQFSRENAFVHMQSETSLPYSTQIYSTDLQSTFGIDIDRISHYSIFQDRQEIDQEKMSDAIERNDRDNSKVDFYLRDFKKHQQFRLKLLLDSIMILNGGAKLTQYGADVSPKVIICAVQSGGNPILSDLVKSSSIGSHLDIPRLIKAIEKGTEYNLFKSPVFIAYRKNFFENEGELPQISNLLKEIGIETPIIFTTPLQLVDIIMSYMQEDE